MLLSQPNSDHSSTRDAELGSGGVPKTALYMQDCATYVEACPATLGPLTTRNSLRRPITIAAGVLCTIILGILLHDLLLLVTGQAVPMSDISVLKTALEFPSGGQLSLNVELSLRNRLLLSGVGVKFARCTTYSSRDASLFFNVKLSKEVVVPPFSKEKLIGGVVFSEVNLTTLRNILLDDDDTGAQEMFVSCQYDAFLEPLTLGRIHQDQMKAHMAAVQDLTAHVDARFNTTEVIGARSNESNYQVQLIHGVSMGNIRAQEHEITVNCSWNYNNIAFQDTIDCKANAASPWCQLFSEIEHAEIHVPALNTHMVMNEPSAKHDTLDLFVETEGLVVDLVNIWNGNHTSDAITVTGGCKVLRDSGEEEECYSVVKAAAVSMLRRQRQRRKLQHANTAEAEAGPGQMLWQMLSAVSLYAEAQQRRVLLQDTQGPIADEMDALLSDLNPEGVFKMKMMCDNLICDFGNEVAETTFEMHLSSDDLIMRLEMGNYLNATMQAVASEVDVLAPPSPPPSPTPPEGGEGEPICAAKLYHVQYNGTAYDGTYINCTEYLALPGMSHYYSNCDDIERSYGYGTCSGCDCPAVYLEGHTYLYLKWDVTYDSDDVSKLESKLIYSALNDSLVMQFNYWDQDHLAVAEDEAFPPYLDVYFEGGIDVEWSSSTYAFDSDNMHGMLRVVESGEPLLEVDMTMGGASQPDDFWDTMVYTDGTILYEGEEYLKISECGLWTAESADRMDARLNCSVEPGVDGSNWPTTTTPRLYTAFSEFEYTSVGHDSRRRLLETAPSSQVTSSGALEVLSGSCTAVDGCVRSPNYPQNYGANEICTMQASQEGYLDVHFFNIHATDGLYVDDVKYEGDSMPALYVDAATALRYESDGAGSAAGFYICLTDKERAGDEKRFVKLHFSMTDLGTTLMMLNTSVNMGMIPTDDDDDDIDMGMALSAAVYEDFGDMSVVSDATSYFSAGDNMTMSMAMEVVEEDETKEELGVSVFADIDGMAVRVTEAADERLYAAVNATTASYADADQLRFGIHLRYDGDEQLLWHEDWALGDDHMTASSSITVLDDMFFVNNIQAQSKEQCLDSDSDSDSDS
ncbi:hypothetical protein CYMTET_7843, partial [Cymbomonas tetramitiformis]